MEEKDINKEVSLEETLAEEQAPDLEEVVTEASTEKDTTVALRNSYEAKEDAIKKKRRFTKKQIALMCVAGFILLVGVGVGLFFLIGTLLANPYDVPEDNFKPTIPAISSVYVSGGAGSGSATSGETVVANDTTFTQEELDLINSAMEKGATDETIIKAIATIYAKANYNKIYHTKQAITVLRGQGSAVAFGADGSMAVRGIKVQYDDYFYYQKAAPIVKCDPIALQTALEKLLVQQERAYTDGVNDYRLTGTLKGDNANLALSKTNGITNQVPFVPVNVPRKSLMKGSYSKSQFYEKGYYREDPREITNLVIDENTIVLNELPKGQKYVVYDETEQIYICRFSLKFREEACVEIGRQYLRDSANSTNLEYTKFDVTLQVWKNGYLKRMDDDEAWAGTAKGAWTTSTSSYASIVYYDLDKAIFTEADAAEYEGENWAEKIIAHYKKEWDEAIK